ncbi:3-dehydroquinate synthase [Pedobacter sandarakinus]|uniref:3-dehydroquinate synthase n=1 Tax=Pedobacter sandarakinus TaxID=353156 RepID=UPI0022461F2C|nr:3-dehydroquinate synthase [Pedobacter sandarakinus]MCX2574965.1 3-dehydroquinate synthase [Pedobacter sandarakinus]
METLTSAGHSLYFESNLTALKALLERNTYSKVFILADEHTSEICLPVFQSLMDDFADFDLIETSAGEENKNIDFCIGIWKTLLDFGADRKSLLINLGGGVITDMGGFIASTYKRGIDFINIPTTLLSQVDASVGGKTGIDIDHVKNMVGTFSLPKMVFIETQFLTTLPQRELLSGFAEMIKHGLIYDKAYYEELKTSNYQTPSAAHIYRSVEIKNEVVTIDPQEKNLRKILNFGHTIGHALESYSLDHDENPLTHGEAIAIGFVCEAALSIKNSTLTKSELKDISEYILSLYPKYDIKEESFDSLLALMQSDKKNEDGNILFSLLETTGKCTFNCRVADSDILSSLAYYNSL